MKKLFARYKIYFDRARMYLSYVQSAAVVLTALKVFNIVPPLWAMPLLLIGFVVACLVVGWADKRMGLFEAEQQRISEQNPMLAEILERIKGLERK
jgi:hypothetical protein